MGWKREPIPGVRIDGVAGSTQAKETAMVKLELRGLEGQVERVEGDWLVNARRRT